MGRMPFLSSNQQCQSADGVSTGLIDRQQYDIHVWNSICIMQKKNMQWSSPHHTCIRLASTHSHFVSFLCFGSKLQQSNFTCRGKTELWQSQYSNHALLSTSITLKARALSHEIRRLRLAHSHIKIMCQNKSKVEDWWNVQQDKVNCQKVNSLTN